MSADPDEGFAVALGVPRCFLRSKSLRELSSAHRPWFNPWNSSGQQDRPTFRRKHRPPARGLRPLVSWKETSLSSQLGTPCWNPFALCLMAFLPELHLSPCFHARLCSPNPLLPVPCEIIIVLPPHGQLHFRRNASRCFQNARVSTNLF